MEDWHGGSFWLFPGLLPEADIEGYGAYMKGHWFAGSWAPCQHSQSIAYKELFPIVLAAHVWGHCWVKKHVLFRSDNDAVVHILNTRTSRVPCLMRLLRSLLFSAARHSFSFSSLHVPGVNNQLADALSVAARNGVPDHLIHALGRWSSSAYQLYIRTPSESLAPLSTKLAVPLQPRSPTRAVSTYADHGPPDHRAVFQPFAR